MSLKYPRPPEALPPTAVHWHGFELESYFDGGRLKVQLGSSWRRSCL